MLWRSALKASGPTFDVLGQTNLAEHAEMFGFGLHVRPKAIPEAVCNEWTHAILQQWPKVKLKVGSGHYKAWQAAKYPCSCHYVYAGAVDHPLYAYGKKPPQPPALSTQC